MRTILLATLTAAAILLVTQIQGAGLPEPEKVQLYWALVGSNPPKPCNPYALTRDDKQIDSASLLYAIRRDYKTVQEIVQASGIPQADAKRKLRDLTECGLVSEKAGRFLVNFPFWDEPLRDEINRLGSEIASRVAEVVESDIQSLETAFKQTSVPALGFTWDDASLLIVGGLLLDTGLNDRGLRNWKIFDPERDTPVRPGDHRYWFRAVEHSWGPYWKFGHDLAHNDSRDLWFGMFYGGKSGRRIEWSEAWDVHDERTKQILFPIVKNGTITIEKLRELSGIRELELTRTLRELAEKKVIRIEDSAVRAGFVVFHEKDLATLFSEIDRVAAKIIEEVYIPSGPVIAERWKAIKPENWQIEKIDKFIHREVFGRVYNLTLDRLIEKGVLPPSPVEPPFGYWGINGRYKVL